VLKRHGLPPAPARRKETTWAEFVRAHHAVLAAADFFTAEVWTRTGLVTCYVLFFIHLATRRVEIAGITRNPDEKWMRQIARNATMHGSGFLANHRYLLHDRDTKFSAGFQSLLASGGITCLPLPARSPNLNAFAERFVRSAKEECLDRLVLFGEGSLRHVLRA
jgi:transposase InsO family protein